MPPNVPSLVSLDLFSSVVELGSISAAAQMHGISQPSASERIRHLERQLGVALLERGPNGSAPTEAGVLVATWADTVISAAYELLHGVDSLSRTKQRIVVASSYTLAEHLLPRWLGRLRNDAPGTEVELRVLNSTSVLDLIRAGHAALGFIESVGPVSGVESRSIGGDELVVVVEPRHPWTRRRTVLAATELASTPLVLREVGSGTREALEAALDAVGLELGPAALELGSSSSARSAAEAGAAPAVLSRLAVSDAIAAGRLRAVPVEGLDLTRTFRAVWSINRSLADPLGLLLDIAAASEPQWHRQSL
ncbi:MAG: LysR family transcriptional regulator [Microthrixaceae bacterium]